MDVDEQCQDQLNLGPIQALPPRTERPRLLVSSTRKILASRISKDSVSDSAAKKHVEHIRHNKSMRMQTNA